MSVKEFMYKGDDAHFIWDTLGFRLHVPKDALPPGVTRIKISVGAAISCEHGLFPANTELVSGVYSISASHAFTKPVTLEIEHTCFLESSDQADNGLVFGHCSKHEPPHHFQIMKKGVFEVNNNFGKIILNRFSTYAILRYLMSHVTPITTQYCAGLYYSEDRRNCHCWNAYFVITKDAGIIKQEVRNYFVEQQIEISPHSPNQRITFNGDQICLDVPRENLSGWKLRTLTRPQILKSDVDSYVDGVIPHCQLHLSHPGGPPTETFEYDLPLTGTDVPSVKMFINCMQATEQALSVAESREYKTLRKYMLELGRLLCHDSKTAHYLFEEGFITMDTFSDVTNLRSMLTDAQKGKVLMEAVLRKVELNLENYEKFVDHLREDVYYQDVVELLDKCYRRLEVD